MMNHRSDTAARRGPAAALGLALALLATSIILPGCSTSNPAGPSASQTFLVDLNGGGDFITIQAALNASSDGDTVLVAPGVYEGPGNRNLVFGGVSIELRGIGVRDEVVVNCDGAGRGFYIGGGAAPVIENLTVANGDTIKGGGMYLEGTSPTIRNVRFVGNAAIDGGGGLYCRNGSPTLEDVLFDFNTAEVLGGGVLCDHASPTLDNVTFYLNEAGGSGGGSGGGLACVFSSPELTGCVFEANTSYFGGAIYCGLSSPGITSCTLVGNVGYDGSAICCNDGSHPETRHTIIAHNQPDEALSCSGSTPYTALSCIFDNGDLNELCGNYTTSMLYVDPLFCDLEAGELTLRAVSQCLPENNDWGVQMGAFGEGCE